MLAALLRHATVTATSRDSNNCCSDVNKDWTCKDKDKDNDKDLTNKDKDKDLNLVLKESLRTRTLQLFTASCS